ncbi:ABC transporter substrate-binding protein [Actinomadura madurae]|uniref:ABC transporter substrate-binding protein n=1 Tax=Actinomadura madurae TaxID=1993 RepID=UPI0020263CA7|nr:ABC transporter substrate-binding protein [Actinomadura madurae]MCP9951479.1 ABC transporter substrate-binding protein [Actinomadura madurae]MCP9968252.1 ABC transporter substrate-binding protein [Actinomadura madurae]MCP9980713.1 ABC transporter substrate-binding protein [Actinomadura madurae]MCQ0007780.1 ABC transporter substrate-binding protein [Actinomadura madurae]MCQ0016909.1 ABC transporter substrate-binding protein [Actinomadura madurae]
MNRLMLSVTALAGAASLLTGCGASGDTTKAASAFADSLPDKNKKSGVLTVVTAPGQPPLTFLSGQGNIAEGNDIDLIKAVGAKLGLKVEVTNAAFPGELIAVASGRYDVVAGAINDTKDRQKTLTFVDYLNVYSALFVQQGNPKQLSDTKSLCGKTAAVLQGSTFDLDIDAINAADCANDKIRASKFPTAAAALLAVRSQRADFAFNDSTTAAVVLKQNPGLERAGGKFGKVAHYGFGVAKSNMELARALQAGLKAIIADGTYAKILAKWGESENSYVEATINNAG